MYVQISSVKSSLYADHRSVPDILFLSKAVAVITTGCTNAQEVDTLFIKRSLLNSLYQKFG